MTSNFELKGVWFLPDNKEKKIYGTLLFDQSKSTKLDLIGVFDEFSLLNKKIEYRIILGITSEGELITLYDCFVSNLKAISREDFSSTISEITTNYIFKGIHIDCVENMLFSKISCEIFNLDEWIGVSGFCQESTNQVQIGNGERKIQYKLPELPKFKIDKTCNGQFKFSVNNIGWTRFQKNVALNQNVEFQLDFDDKKDFKRLFNYIVRFQNFLILALNQATSIVSVKLAQDVNNSASIKVFFTNTSIQNSRKVKFDLQMLFDYQRINEDFSSIIQNWFSKYDLLEPSLNLLFDQFYKGKSLQ